MRIPLLAGAGGNLLLSHLPDEEIDDQILSKGTPKKFTPFSCTNKRQYKEMIGKARRELLPYMMESNYIEATGPCLPLRLNKDHLKAAIWVVGLKGQIKDEVIPLYRPMLKEIAGKIGTRFSLK
jgi:DNA-binding IclR family transcriptional regulator